MYRLPGWAVEDHAGNKLYNDILKLINNPLYECVDSKNLKKVNLRINYSSCFYVFKFKEILLSSCPEISHLYMYMYILTSIQGSVLLSD